MLNDDEIDWIVDACRASAALLFIWNGRYGDQPVLMSGYTFLWWAPRKVVH